MSNTISILGGGTGANTAAAARTNLGIGTLGVQDAGAVAITGGSVAGNGAGLTSLNATNLASGTVPQARKWTSATVTLTGNQDNLNFSGADELRCNNASLLTIRGLAAGVAGQRLRIISVGAGQVDLAHQNAGSTAANRLINFATSASTPLAAGVGVAEYEYDATTQRWRLVQHEQGAWITPAFSAGDYTANGAMTWTVGSGDVFAAGFYLIGRMLTVGLSVGNSSVGGTASTELRRAIPGGFLAATDAVGLTRAQPGNNTWGVGVWYVGPGQGAVRLIPVAAGGNWTISTDNVWVQGTLVIPLQ